MTKQTTTTVTMTTAGAGRARGGSDGGRRGRQQKQQHNAVVVVATLAMSAWVASAVSTLEPHLYPSGSYCLPQPWGGCPAGFVAGVRDYDTEDTQNTDRMEVATSATASTAGRYLSASNTFPNVPGFALASRTRFESNTRENFCCTANDGAGVVRTGTWPAGSYCVYRRGGSCPAGFNGCAVYSDDEDTLNANKRVGTLPDGVYDMNTRVQLCCRNDAPVAPAVFTSNGQPMVMYRGDRQLCPSTWARVFKDTEDTSNTNAVEGFCPPGVSITGAGGGIQLHYCGQEAAREVALLSSAVVAAAEADVAGAAEALEDAPETMDVAKRGAVADSARGLRGAAAAAGGDPTKLQTLAGDGSDSV